MMMTRSAAVAASCFNLTTDTDDRATLVSCRLDRSASYCYRLFCDVEAVPLWLPVVTEARVRARDARGRPKRVDFVAKLESSSVAYALDYSYDDRKRRISWRAADGGVAALSGSADFAPTDDGGCLMQYRLYTELPGAMADWADSLYASRPADAVVVAFCDWICRKTRD